MKRPSFLEGVAVAAVTSIGVTILYTALVWFMVRLSALEGVVTLAGFFYVLYLLLRSRERAGRISILGFWVMIAAICWIAPLPLHLFIIVHLGMIWLVRSLYHHSSLLSALADLLLIGTGVAAAVWTATYTHSLFLAVWCFFLIQALFSAIPKYPVAGSTASSGSACTGDDPFERAHRAAEAALRRLSTIHR